MSGIYRIGMHALADNGSVGTVEDILVGEDDQPRYLVVRDQGVFAESAVIPVASAVIDGDAVRIAMAKDEIHAAPRFDTGTHGESAGLYSVSAKQFDRRRDE